MTDVIIDIDTQSDSKLGKALSNFSNWGFEFDNIPCRSIESALQSFKFKDSDMQRRICGRLGYLAKYDGLKTKDVWKEDQILYWKGKEYRRDSKEYQELLDRLYQCCFTQNMRARRTLMETGKANLVHRRGKTDITDTVLTTKEFVSRLMKLRDEKL